jgi:lactate dehydrogenase-like 2-hydroxyacid dehydrogenase
LSPTGAFIVNTSSCQLIDDCALKQLLLDGTIAGCALDGAEGPQWMEAWVWNLDLSTIKSCSKGRLDEK